MTNKELIDAFRDEADSMAALVAGKNAGYTGGNGNGFRNFELVEHITGGKITREVGCFVRMCDKVGRIWALLNDGNADQVGESFGDTTVDLSAYGLLLKLMYNERLDEKRAVQGATAGTVHTAESHIMNAAAEFAAKAHTGEPSLGMHQPPAESSAWSRLAEVLRAR